MSRPHAATIQFIDGPFDGHVEPISVTTRSLPPQIACFISNNVFRSMEGLSHENRCRITSIAIYERRHFDGLWTYEFIRSVAPGDARIHAGQVTFESKERGATNTNDQGEQLH